MYVLLGETDVGHRRMLTRRRIDAASAGSEPRPTSRGAGRSLSGQSISHFPAVGARPLPEGHPAIDRMIAEIDTARACPRPFCIWLDGNGTRRGADPRRRAASPAGPWSTASAAALTRSPLWQRMDGGVQLDNRAEAGQPPLPWRNGRVDLRDHRKDRGHDTRIFCGSQKSLRSGLFCPRRASPPGSMWSCASPAPSRQNRFCPTDRGDQRRYRRRPSQPEPPHMRRASRAGHRHRPDAPLAMPGDVRPDRRGAARRLITTPYFAPDGALLSSICRRWRGVDTTIIFSARNDDFVGCRCASPQPFTRTC